ncbi:TIGR04222 domain-containing membrane protein [Budviciaceae bacterium BWR-B9]|uniref:TIGR04222 domain-containing membrane protein n=1 Tax=Limnobaculum allomyrinae TaxID=2791986 RepID=A0ABS1IQQ5_9GAMM|nr:MULTISPECIES: TIGR04222 domain-containing membrane protein [Limnobaculum]MBK5144086.1 TIGR04222 domain-containing membrane protein [Limnobaculum allomyrinae]MBV7691745.1 TIGR04222 domain-containing membrane protein [Limnobaculum sp. M2-1]
MTWTVMSNPIVDMYGPWFLLFYLIYCIAIMIATGMISLRCYPDTSRVDKKPGLLPSHIDPYFLAWLQSGREKVLQLAMMRLSYSGLLVPGSKSTTYMLRPVTNPESIQPKMQELNRLETLVFSCFEQQHEQSKEWAFNALAPTGRNFRAKAQKEGLVYSAISESLSAMVAWIGFILLTGMGAYKLIIAWGNGYHNVIFLSLMMLFFGWIHYRIFLRHRADRVHLTNKGKIFLERLSASLPRDKKSLKKLDIAMAVVALSTSNFIYSECSFGQHAYLLNFAVLPPSGASGRGAAGGNSSSGGADSDSSSSSDSGSSSGCSGCGGCGGGD